jgi:uncharacterized metal-binding protein YceD (DUF177 family)
MPRSPVAPHPIRLTAGGPRRVQRFALCPDAGERAALAGDLGIDAIGRLDFRGSLTPEGRSDWRLEAVLSASVVQPCVITLEPVTTAIRETVTRRYVDGWQEPRGDEVEMPADDSAEPLPDAVDPAQVMAEALALALPVYPRRPGAGLDTAEFTAPGSAGGAALRRPFAGLADLLGGGGGGGDSGGDAKGGAEDDDGDGAGGGPDDGGPAG